MNAATPFSVRAFLRSREALLVHFNTPMSLNHPTGFPNDLHSAKTLAGPLSFSTIQVGDRGPWQGGHPADANAGGSVGLIVDVNDSDSVLTVASGDSGSGFSGSGGLPPDAQTCADSITGRVTANEWWVQNYTPIGIFVILPAQVFVRLPTQQGERPSDLNEVLTSFPNDRIFSTWPDTFVEYDRANQVWTPTTRSDRSSLAPPPQFGRIIVNDARSPNEAMLVRAAGVEPARASRPYGFSYHFGFRRRRVGVRGLDYPFAVARRP
jgi:hypothetical protein